MVDIGEWWRCGGGRLERFYCMCVATQNDVLSHLMEPITSDGGDQTWWLNELRVRLPFW